MTLQDKINCGILLFDGAMGTMLQNAGQRVGELPEIMNIRSPKTVQNVHRAYIEAGADIITTNTFGANGLKLKKTPHTVQEVIFKAVQNAKVAAGDANIYIALDIGPLGELLAPMGTLPFEDAYELFRAQVVSGVRAGVDVILIETMTDLYEAKAAVLAAKEHSNLPVFCTMSYGSNGRTFTGCSPQAMILTLEGLAVDAIGINCSLGPKEMESVVDEILRYATCPVMVQANAGIPVFEDNHVRYDVSADEFAAYARRFVEKGVRIIGGCCGTTDLYTAKIAKQILGMKPMRTTPCMLDGVCTPTNVVKMDGVRIVGERINPTGKPVLKKAIMENDYSPLVKEAIDQVESGAHILDINVGVPSVDEALAMAEAVRLIQSVVDAPVQIDSANPSAIEAGLRICNGKAIVNSVNGMDCTLDRILPIVRKYGAAVIGLTMDENGIPDSALKRLRIAEKIQRKVLEYGIKKEDLYIDCLVLTAASEQRSVLQTLETVRLVKEQLGLKTVLGVSNVSFGFPDRALINKVFLAACLREGLDMAIMDPTDSGMTETVLASNLLWNHDRGGLEYIRTRHLQPERAIENEFHSMGVADLQSAILRGSKEEVRFATAYLLKQKEPLRIVDEYLIPALDRVGKLYEEQKIFLPQLIRCAEAAQLSFAEFPSTFNLSVSECRDRRKIVLATVKGDIHDIGKNLVKVLLESYQFDVIDLGKDVKPESILRAAIERKAQMVGLSSLMTTTINNMGETVQLLKQNLPGVYIMVGGAVLDEHCAREMGADAYGNDAQAAVRIAKEYFRVMGKNE